MNEGLSVPGWVVLIRAVCRLGFPPGYRQGSDQFALLPFWAQEEGAWTSPGGQPEPPMLTSLTLPSSWLHQVAWPGPRSAGHRSLFQHSGEGRSTD